MDSRAHRRDVLTFTFITRWYSRPRRLPLGIPSRTESFQDHRRTTLLLQLVLGSWFLVIGYWLLVIGYWLAERPLCVPSATADRPQGDNRRISWQTSQFPPPRACCGGPSVTWEKIHPPRSTPHAFRRRSSLSKCDRPEQQPDDPAPVCGSRRNNPPRSCWSKPKEYRARRQLIPLSHPPQSVRGLEPVRSLDLPVA